MYTPEPIVENKGNFKGWRIEKVTSFYPKSDRAFGKNSGSMFSKRVTWYATPETMTDEEWAMELRTNPDTVRISRMCFDLSTGYRLRSLKGAINKFNEAIRK